MDLDFLHEHRSKAMYLLQSLYVDTAPIIMHNELFDLQNRIVLSTLYTSLHTSSESVLELISSYSLFDAEVILRTLIEGTVKFLFMMHENLLIESTIIKEYYEIIPEMQKINEHNKAIESMSIFKKYSKARNPIELSILSDTQIRSLMEKYPKRDRRIMEQKWGFGTLLKKLIEKNSKYENLVGLYYSYNLSSNFLHYDGNGLKLRFLAITSAGQNNYTVEKAHALRLINNVITLSLLRFDIYLIKNNIDNQKELLVKMKSLYDYSAEIQTMSENLIKGCF